MDEVVIFMRVKPRSRFTKPIGVVIANLGSLDAFTQSSKSDKIYAHDVSNKAHALLCKLVEVRHNFGYHIYLISATYNTSNDICALMQYSVGNYRLR